MQRENQLGKPQKGGMKRGKETDERAQAVLNDGGTGESRYYEKEFIHYDNDINQWFSHICSYHKRSAV